jgi:hypothetical protein
MQKASDSLLQSNLADTNRSIEITTDNNDFPTRDASSQDPYGLIPVGWINSAPIHPDARVAFSGSFGTGGLYLVTLIPPDSATLEGIQTFYLESLTDWESIQVIDEPQSNENDNTLTIVARKEGAMLEIITEPAPQGFCSTLPNYGHWLSCMGPAPLVARLYYTPLTDIPR